MGLRFQHIGSKRKQYFKYICSFLWEQIRQSRITIVTCFGLIILYLIELALLQHISHSQWEFYFVATPIHELSVGAISGAFFHHHLRHLFLNISGFFIIGILLEPRIPRRLFVSLVLVSAISGSFVQTIHYTLTNTAGSGQGWSGAVRGITSFAAVYFLAASSRFSNSVEIPSNPSFNNNFMKWNVWKFLGWILMVIIIVSATSEISSEYSPFVDGKVAVAGHFAGIAIGFTFAISFILWISYANLQNLSP